MLISKDSKLNSEEEEKVKPIIMPEKDWLHRIKINITHTNIDLLSESPALKLLLKSFIQPSKVIRY